MGRHPIIGPAAGIAALAMLLAAGRAAAGIELNWDHCGSGVKNQTFNCIAGTFYRLVGTYELPAEISEVVELRITLDIDMAGGSPTPPFWRFEPGGCNHDRLTLTDAGIACTEYLTALSGGAGQFSEVVYSPDYSEACGRGTFRVAMLIARQDVGVMLAGTPAKHYAFSMAFALPPGGAACEGCDQPAGIRWTKAEFVNSSDEVVAQLGCDGQSVATVNGGTLPDCSSCSLDAGEQEPVPAGAFEVSPPWPNPSSRAAHVRFRLPVAATVSVGVFDLTGRRVAILLESQRLPEGLHEASWDGRDAGGLRVPAGVYQVRVMSGRAVAVRKIVLVRD